MKYFLAILPVAVFFSFIYIKDFRKEPTSMLIKLGLLGCFSTFISLLFSVPMSSLKEFFGDPIFHSFYMSFLQASVPEELAKFIVLYMFVWKHRDFDDHFDGIVYSVCVSLGFALVENILYVHKGGIQVAIIRAIFSVPGHGFFGIIMGYYLTLARFSSNYLKKIYLFKAICGSVLAHGFYDFLLFYISDLGDVKWFKSILFVVFIWFFIKLKQFATSKVEIHLKSDFEKHF